MATETPNVVHALATIGLVSGVPTLLKSNGIRSFANPSPGLYALELETGIAVENAEITVTGRKGYCYGFSAEMSSENTVIVNCVGSNNVLANVPMNIAVHNIPLTEATTTDEDATITPTNWSGGAGTTPFPSGGALLFDLTALSQFATQPAPSAFSSGWVNPGVTYVADDTYPQGGYFLLAADSGAGGAHATWYFNTLVPLVNIKRIEVEITAADGVNVADIAMAGVIIAGDLDGANTHGIELLYGLSAGAPVSCTLYYGNTAGSLLSVDLPAGNAYFARQEIDVNAIRGDAVTYPPDGRPVIELNYTIPSIWTTSLQGITGGTQSDKTWTYQAGWGASDCNQIGLSLFTTSGAANPVAIKVLSLKIFGN